MQRYEPFHTKFWTDTLVKTKLQTGAAKLLFIYSWTNESCGMTGIYDFDVEVCQLRTGIRMRDFKTTMKEVVDSGLVKYDHEKQKIWVVNRFKYINTSPKIIQSAINELKGLDHPFKGEFIEKYEGLIKPFLLQLDGVLGKKEAETMLTAENVGHLAKIYSKPDQVKAFLYKRGLNVVRVDQIVGEVFDNIVKKAENEI